jgi:hypothetical protein
MLNNYNSFKIGAPTTNVSFNTPSMGMIQKSHPLSKFVKFHFTSQLSGRLLDSIDEAHVLKSEIKQYSHISDSDRWKPHAKTSYTEETKIPVTVLQLMVFGADQFIAEIVYNSDLVDMDK